MKTFKTVSKLALVVLTVFMVSCSKDDPAPTPTPTPIPASGSFITATVDGTAFSTNIFGVSTASVNRVGTGPNALIQILGSDLSASSISINLIDLNIVAGQTYNLNPSLDGSVIAYVSASTSGAFGTGICEGSSGTMRITAYDNTKIEGTFSFIGKNGDNCSATAKNVTNGSFRGVFTN